MIHTYSLIHDDLPAMDNDHYRRGRLTTWAVYGDGMAVIAGDGLLNYAFETAAGAFDACHDLERMRRCAKALQVLGRNAGIYGMVGGQCADLVSEKAASPVSEDTLLFIHRNKTAALIDSGLVIGAVLAGAPEEDIRKLHQIAEEIGLAFQIRDDILDVSGSQETLGKSIGKDAAEGKATKERAPYVRRPWQDGSLPSGSSGSACNANEIMDSLRGKYGNFTGFNS